ncbi:MAG: hypothetical protein ACOCXJ_04060 [Planctomycetota bacterium]
MSDPGSTSCDACPMGDCPGRDPDGSAAAACPSPSAAAAAVTFLLPLICALGASLLNGGPQQEGSRIGMAFVGLLIGMLLSAGLVRLFWSDRRRELQA